MTAAASSITPVRWANTRRCCGAVTSVISVDVGVLERSTRVLVLPGDFDTGLTFYEVSPSTEALWQDDWARFKAGA